MVHPSERALLWLDDLPRHVAVGGSLEAEELARLGTLIDALEHPYCRALYVVATARDEHLQPAHREFFTRHNFLSIPMTDFGANLIGDLVDRVAEAYNIPVELEARRILVERREGSPLHVVLMFRTWAREGKKTISPADAEALIGKALRELWNEQYQDLIHEKPSSRYLFEALGILDAADVPPFTFLALDLAARLMPRYREKQAFWEIGPLAVWARHRDLCEALAYLQCVNIRDEEGTVTYHAVQVEERGDLEKGLPVLRALLFDLSRRWRLVWYRLTRHSRRQAEIYFALLGLGNTDLFSERPDQAEKMYRRAMRIAPKHPWVHNNLGNLLDDMQRYGEAEAAYRQAIELNPSDATAYNNLGGLLDDMQRYGEAEAAYRQAIELNPLLWQAFANLGILLENSGCYSEAESAYRRVIELEPTVALIYYRLANLLVDAGRFQEAEPMWREYIKLQPEDALALNQLGLVLRVLGRVEEAIPFLQKSYDLKPRAMPLLSLAGVYRKLGQTAEYERAAQQVRAMLAEDDWYNRACLESVCGDVGRAIELLKIAAEKGALDREWAQRDPDLAWIREDPRFGEIVGEV
jgi:tetratricopeptide (TPR) repeat protein